MRRLPSIILLLGFAVTLYSQSPHGSDLKIDCAACHTPDGWEVSYKAVQFNHDSTRFALSGRHTSVDCRSCHISMIFSEAGTECIDCHTDIHNQTVGMDCARCHTPQNWLVDNITELHQDNGFPLVGAHATSSCNQCHVSETALRFDRIGNDCINCHADDYASTTNPNHGDAGYSTDCIICHDVTALDWSSQNINHNFFPLTKGHDIADCASCHTSGSYSNTPTDCAACHQADYAGALNPNHVNANFPTDCASCHTTDPGWMPATFTQHDADYFPIYSGEHEGEWDQCMDCHTDPSNFAVFSCTICHQNPETNEEHDDVNGYVYESPACLACHPTGDANLIFDHNMTQFPLTGAHTTTSCLECHAAGYQGTSTACIDCHTVDYNQTDNPNHVALIFSTDCTDCHGENTWVPSTFDHAGYYPFTGAHVAIANDCAACHHGDYVNTPTTCAGCHTPDYNQTTNPNHMVLGLSTDCVMCHSTAPDWTPATFLIHDNYYTLNGAHAAIANDCATCHNGDYTDTPNTCFGCHADDYNNTTGPNHATTQFSINCTDCHGENAWVPSNFDHDAQYFPIYSGQHEGEWSQCTDCHTNPSNYAKFTCITCHANPETDEEHQGVGGYSHNSLACLACHPTGDADLIFDHNTTNFPLTGEHAAAECLQCHATGFIGTSTNCVDCHTDQFNQAANPNHISAQFPTTCANCHSENAWTPATFDHDNMYFPIYSGKHDGEWNQCVDCHTVPGNFSLFSCIDCHEHDDQQQVDDDHDEVSGYTYTSAACYSCHPNGDN